MLRRRLSEADVLAVARRPEQQIDIRPGRVLAQAIRHLVGDDDRVYLPRVVIDNVAGRSGDRDGVQDQSDHEVLEGRPMKVSYDQKSDTLTVVFKESAAVAISDDAKPGAILDFDGAGELVSIEILDASRRVSEATRVDFELIKD